MGLRFRKSFGAGPFRLSFGKRSAGISAGGKLGRIGINTRTGARVGASLPGTGLSVDKPLGRQLEEGEQLETKGQKTNGVVTIACPACDAPVSFSETVTAVECNCGSVFSVEVQS